MIIVSPRTNGWHQPHDTGIPWTLSLSNALAKHYVPKLTGTSLYVTTDSSGEHKASKYDVISVLVFDMDYSPEWPPAIRALRSQHLLDGRRMAFKSLGDQQRRDALIPFLKCTDKLTGICLSVAFNKRIGPLFRQFAEHENWERLSGIKAKWSSASLERMLRQSHLVAFMVAGLCSPNQNVIWISDEDEIFTNDLRKQDTARMLSVFTNLHIPHQLGELQVGTTEIDPGDHYEEDLAAIPDLVAGASAEALNSNAKYFGKIPMINVQLNGISEKTNLLLDWFSRSSNTLLKLGVVFDPASEGRICLKTWNTAEDSVLYGG